MDKQQKDTKEWWILTDKKYHISRESRIRPNQPHRLNKVFGSKSQESYQV